jgi:hypothetical protein
LKKLIGSFLVGSLLYVMPYTADAASLSETEKQVNVAAKASTILHDKYTHSLDYKTLIGAPYNNARYEVGKAKKMVDTLPNSDRKNQLLTRVAGYQKVVNNGNAYNNAVRTYPILLNYQKNHLDHYVSDGTLSNWYPYNYFNYKLSSLQANYDKVYGKYIQQNFKQLYLEPIKNTRDTVYYILSADTHLDRAKASLYKDTNEAQRRLNLAAACLEKVSAPKRKALLEERAQLIQNFLNDEITGIHDTFYITKNDSLRMKVSFNFEGNLTLWIADADKYPSYESLKTAGGRDVYGYSSIYNSDKSEQFVWSYRDWGPAYQPNLVHNYERDILEIIEKSNETIIPIGKEIRIVLEVVQADGKVVVKEEVVTMTEDLYQKSLAR